MSFKPKKEDIDKFLADKKAYYNMYLYITASYILASLSNEYTEAFTGEMKKRKLLKGADKMGFTKYKKAFDEYNMIMRSLVPNGPLGTAFCADYDDLKNLVESYLLGEMDKNKEGDGQAQ